MIDCSKFEKSLEHLKNQLGNHLASSNRTELSRLDRDAIAESVVQRFETCYDVLWKTLRRHLFENLGLPDVPNSPNLVFMIAAQNGVFSSPADQWMAYANARTNAAHDYSGEKASSTLAIVPQFVGDASALLATLKGYSSP